MSWTIHGFPYGYVHCAWCGKDCRDSTKMNKFEEPVCMDCDTEDEDGE
jgi:hypothetical protein